MNQSTRDREPQRLSLRLALSRFLFPGAYKAQSDRLHANVAHAASTPEAAYQIEAERESEDAQDAELIVAVFRTAILLVIIFAPRLLGLSVQSEAREFWLAALASVYNIGALVACLVPHRFGLRRPFIVLMDVMLITTWIRLSGQWDLFPFYFVVVVVAAMWFRVAGGVITALACDILYVLIWSRFANPDSTVVPPLPVRLALEILLLVVVGCVAGYIAKAQENERRRRLANQLLIAQYQHEIDISAQLQPLLVSPSLFNGNASTPSGAVELSPHLEVGAAMQTARTGFGGDYFDLIALPEERIGLCIADVSGKSVRAQARLPLLKYALRALAPLYLQPDELVAQLDETLRPDLQPDFYIALCYIVLDPKRQVLSWCNAGHIAPLLIASEAHEKETAVSQAVSLLRREKPAAESTPLQALGAPGPPLGMFEDARYAMRSLPWSAGDQLLLFTDGLSDSLGETAITSGSSEEDEGEALVQELALRLAGLTERSAQDIAQEFVNQAVLSMAGSTPSGQSAPERTSVRDDVTVVFARYLVTDASSNPATMAET